MNVINGNGAAVAGGPPLPPGVSNTFGIGLVGTSKDNLIEENRVGGNVNGVYIGSTTQGGNIIRRNIIAGNPPVQVSETFGPAIGADIQEVSLLGGNTFEKNLCVTYAGPTVPAPCPSISKPRDDEDGREGEISANRATTPFRRSFQHANVGRNRLAFPQARLINAVFHLK